MRPGQFFARVPLRLAFDERADDEVYWELFHGRALDHTMTRRREQFHSWNVWDVSTSPPAGEPLVSVKQDAAGRLFVTRGVLSHVHESYEAGPNTIETRPAQRRIRELVAELDAAGTGDNLADAVLLAVVGTSRLPLTSVESPLTEFAMGWFGYLPIVQPPDQPFDELTEWLARPAATDRFRVRQLELFLRAADAGHVTLLSRQLAASWGVADLRELFRGVSLSPYTGLVGNVLVLLRAFELQDRLDFLTGLLTLLWRHLNAYDLVTFHHRGANYPDALLVDEVLRDLLTDVDVAAWHGAGARRRRRGLRLGWLVRCLYAGQPVSGRPTSPGESLRVLPEPYRAVSGSRSLFDGPLELSVEADAILNDALAELSDCAEAGELGTALVLDRPLGTGTPLFSHVAHSRRLAQRVLSILRVKADDRLRPFLGQALDEALAAWQPSGVPLPRLSRPVRPGVVSLNDVLQVADDWVISRTTRVSVNEYLDAIGEPSAGRERWHVVLPRPAGGGEELAVYDRDYVEWRQITVDGV